MQRWIVCQIGAREHYAVARALYSRGLLEELITDTWVPGGSLFGRLPGRAGARLAGRYEPSLATAQVTHMGVPALLQRAWQRLSWEENAFGPIMRHNAQFEAYAARRLRDLVRNRVGTRASTVFAYSYAARHLLDVAKQAGLRTVLGQIDGGPAEYELVAQISQRHGMDTVAIPPASYWEGWRAECALADRIVVNSAWSGKLLMRAGIDAAKISVVPLIHETGAVDRAPRLYPRAFTADRPLVALFLGSLIARKGIVEVLDAAGLLHDAPVEFRLVGPDPEAHGRRASRLPNVKLIGPVPRAQVQKHYDQADVFLFPTHCDGFGLTQLEAQACGLPVLTTPYCGDVVEHRRNGLIANEVSAGRIATLLQHCLEHPDQLDAMSAEALRTGRRFSSDAVLPKLLSLFDKQPAGCIA